MFVYIYMYIYIYLTHLLLTIMSCFCVYFALFDSKVLDLFLTVCSNSFSIWSQSLSNKPFEPSLATGLMTIIYYNINFFTFVVFLNNLYLVPQILLLIYMISCDFRCGCQYEHSPEGGENDSEKQRAHSAGVT